MPTVISHSIVGFALGKTIKWKQSTSVAFYSFACGSLSDLDFVGRYFGIKYLDHWGHRGWSHSLLMASIIGLVLGYLCSQKGWYSKLGWWLYFTVLTSTHTLLDMCTTGGHGVALYAPWSHLRHFFPDQFRVVRVSPMHFHHFTWEKLAPVFMSELLWLILPITCLLFVRWVFEARRA